MEMTKGIKGVVCVVEEDKGVSGVLGPVGVNLDDGVKGI